MEQVEHLQPGEVYPEHANALDRRIVCVFETDSLAMTPELWARIYAKFQAVGRMLTDQEVQSIVRAQAGQDRDG